MSTPSRTSSSNLFGNRYVVDPTASAGSFSSISSAIAAAVANGGGTVFINPGRYATNLAIPGNVNLVGSTGSSNETNSAASEGGVQIVGNVTITNFANNISIENITFTSTAGNTVTISSNTTSGVVSFTGCRVVAQSGLAFSIAASAGSGYTVFFNGGSATATTGIVDASVSESVAFQIQNSILTSNPGYISTLTGAVGLTVLNCIINSTGQGFIGSTGFNNNVVNGCIGTFQAEVVNLSSIAASANFSNCNFDCEAMSGYWAVGTGTLTYGNMCLIASSGTPPIVDSTLISAPALPVFSQPFATAGSSSTAVVGTAGFDSTQFTVSDLGFVQLVGGGGGTIQTLTGNSGGAVGPTTANINTVGTGSITVVGNPGTSTLTAELTGLTNHAVLVGAGTTTITKVGPTATAGQVLQSAGSSTDPAFSTATYPSTTTANDILYSSATNVVGQIATAANGVLITNNSSVPSLLANSSTPNYVLTANSGAPPSWQAAPAGGNGFTSINIKTFTTSGTYTPTSGMMWCEIEVLGAGGGSGGCAITASGQCTASGGGGAGGYAKGAYSAVSIGASQSVTIGAGGSAGVSGNNAGGTGGTTSVGSLLSATGGVGGLGSASSNGTGGAGGAGGAGTGGSFQTSGAPGLYGIALAFSTGAYAVGGAGGSCFFGGGSEAGGINGTSYGGGASGTQAIGSTAAQVGYAGAAGLVVITEYIGATGGWVLLSNQIVSNVASVSFTSFISSSYSTYILVFSDVVRATANAILEMQVSTNNGSSYISTNYQAGISSTAYNSATVANVNSTSSVHLDIAGDNTAPGTSGTLWLYNLQNGGAFIAVGNSADSASSVLYTNTIGATNTATSVNAIQLAMSSGNITTGTFSLYALIE